MNFLSIAISLLASLILLFMGVFVLIKNWRDQVNRYYFFFTFNVFGLIFTMFLIYSFPDYYYLTQVNRVTQLFTALFGASLLNLSLVFPKSVKKFPLYISVLVMIPAIIIGSVVCFTDLSIIQAYFQDGKFIRQYNKLYYVYSGTVIIYFLLGLINFIRKYFKTDVDIYKLQLRYFFVGVAVASILGSITSIILPVFFNYTDLYIVGPSIAAIFASMLMFYSVINYNLMDMSIALYRSPIIFMISLFSFVPIFSIIYIYKMKYFRLNEIPLYIISFFMILIFIFFNNKFRPWLSGFFKKKELEFEEEIKSFIENIEKVKDSDEVIKRTIDVLYEILELNSTFFIIFNDVKREYELFYIKNRGTKSEIDMQLVDRNSILIKWFVRNHDLLTRERIYTDDRSFVDIRFEIANFYKTNNISMIMPIYHEKMVFGLICLGTKANNSSFTSKEIESLKYFHIESNEFISAAFFFQKATKDQFLKRTNDLASFLLSKAVPKSLPLQKGIKLGAFIIPRYKEGIDYFDFIHPGDKGIGIMATDVSGVGITSALNSVMLRSAFQSCINEAHSTYAVMQTLNKVLYSYSKGKGSLITAFYMFFDHLNMRLMYTNAGFPALEIFRVEKSDFDSLDTEGIPLGYDESSNYGVGRTNLQKDDIGIIYSKSLLSSTNPHGEEFGLFRMRNLIRDNRTRRPTEISEIIKNNYIKFMDVSIPISDVLLLIFKIV